MLIAVAGTRMLLSGHLPPTALLLLETAVGAVTFLGAVRILGPSLLTDVRTLLRDLVRPEASQTPADSRAQS